MSLFFPCHIVLQLGQNFFTAQYLFFLIVDGLVHRFGLMDKIDGIGDSNPAVKDYNTNGQNPPYHSTNAMRSHVFLTRDHQLLELHHLPNYSFHSPILCRRKKLRTNLKDCGEEIFLPSHWIAPKRHRMAPSVVGQISWILVDGTSQSTSQEKPINKIKNKRKEI